MSTSSSARPAFGSASAPQALQLRVRAQVQHCCCAVLPSHSPSRSLPSLTKALVVLLLLALLSPPPLSAALTSSFDQPGNNRFTNAEINLIRTSFLKRFGMKEQPKQELPVLPVPTYMWDIYDKVQSEEVEWVRHYYPQRIMETDDRLLLLRYNLTVTVQNATNERILRADLKLKLNKGIAKRRVKIYEVDQRNPDVMRLLDSKQVEPDPKKDHQWVDMDVSEALTRRRPNRNRVDFAVELSDARMARSLPTTATVSAMPYSRTQAAALVVYVETNDEAAKIRRKRRAGGKRRHQHRKHNHRVGSAERNLCQRRELHVDFNELNWQDWILAPPSYSAYQCQGECPNPLTAHFNTTNHAIVQSLINAVNPRLVPAPCCVPIEMESLAILYIDVESKIVIKNYPDMEVISCGCR